MGFTDGKNQSNENIKYIEQYQKAFKGCAIFPVHSDTKKRISEATVSRRSRGDFLAYAKKYDCSIGISLGGTDFCDIDLDCTEAEILATYLLPPTSASFGPGDRTTHLIYHTGPIAVSGHNHFYDPKLQSGKKKKTEDHSMIVELRQSGGFTVVPPAKHKSGHDLEWKNGVKPSKVDPKELRKDIALLAFAVVLSRYWKRGGWHNGAVCIAGGFASMGVPQETAEYFMDVVCKFMDMEDVKTKVQAVKDTYKKKEKGSEALAGFAQLEEYLGRETVEAVRRWISFAWDVDDASLLSPRATHIQIVEHYLTTFDPKPVGFGGQLYVCDKEHIWHPYELEHFHGDLGTLYGFCQRCTQGNHYRALANLLYYQQEDSRFFADTPIGVAAQNAFYTIDARGIIGREELTAEHRQRFRVELAPKKTRPSAFIKFLERSIDNGDKRAQLNLLQEVLGCAVVGGLTRYKTAALFYGPHDTGKSTLLAVIRGLLPSELVSSISPTRWGEPYYAAELARSHLNLVGDMDTTRPIPPEFKDITGGDLISGRRPSHSPFSFVCEASHIFNSNHFPRTQEHSQAFYIRWRIVHFANTIPKKQQISKYDEVLLEKEGPQILWWLLQGAAKARKQDYVSETRTHRALLSRWQRERNNVLAFVYDGDVVEINDRLPAARCALRSSVYRVYRKWCFENSRKSLNKGEFYSELETTGFGFVKSGGEFHVQGVKLLKEGKM